MPAPDALPQYSLTKIVFIWLAAALPMPFLAFWVAPHLARTTGLHPGIAIWALMILGMAWQGLMSVLLLRPEAAAARHTGWARRLWLQAPQDPQTGAPRLRLLWWLLPVIAGSALIEIGGIGVWLGDALAWVAPALARVPAPNLAGLATPEFVGA